jgi:hydrogenase-4 component F
VVSSTFARQPLLSIVLVAGLLIAFGALILRLQDIVFGDSTGKTGPTQASYIPAFIHLTLVLIAGLWLPGPMVQWFRGVAALLR